MLTLLPTLLILLALPCIRAASQIALFADSDCRDSLKGLEGPNGYPNGSCTDLRRSGTYGSLQVVGLDPGCSVTIYVQDDDTTICGGYQEEIQLASCWNSTFVYYSIDMCDPPSPSTTPSPSSSKLPTGPLVGGILGGLAAGALLLGLALWLLARRKRAKKARIAAAAAAGYQGGYQGYAHVEAEARPGRGEMDAGGYRYEMGTQKVVYKQQATEVAQPPVELEGEGGDVWRGDGRDDAWRGVRGDGR